MVVLLNAHRIVDNGVIHVSFSDHSVIYGILRAGIPKAPPLIIEYGSFKLY